MKYVYVSIAIAAILLLFSACHSHDHAHDGHSHGVDNHAEVGSLAYTVRTNHCELFIEFTPLVAGKERRLAAHFSDMQNFKAIEEGEVTAQLREGKRIVTKHSVSVPESPGIFCPIITPDKKGTHTLYFILTTSVFTDTIRIPNVIVYENTENATADNPVSSEGDIVSFTKEQAWKTDFAVTQAKRQSIHNVVRTSGEIQPVKGEEKVVVTRSSGIVFYTNTNLQEGRTVKRGESLFTISSKGLLENNIEGKYLSAKARLEKSTKRTLNVLKSYWQSRSSVKKNMNAAKWNSRLRKQNSIHWQIAMLQTDSLYQHQ